MAPLPQHSRQLCHAAACRLVPLLRPSFCNPMPNDLLASEIANGPTPGGTAPAALPPAPRRLLVLSYYFPPADAIGGMRWAGLTRHLASLGWQIWVLRAPAPGSARAPDGVTVEACTPGRTVSERLQRYPRLVRAFAPTERVESDAGSARAQGAGWSSVLWREAFALVLLANEGRGWVLRAARRARALIARVQPHVVVSTSPPHGTHLAAWLATRGKPVRWFMDLRDPWAGPVTQAWQDSSLVRGRLASALIAREERLWVNAATGVLTTTRELADALTLRYPGRSVTWIPNAVERDLLPPPSPDPFPGLAIAHMGTLYGGRDLKPVLAALRAFLDRHPDADGSVRLRTAGLAEPDRVEALRHDIAALSVGPYVDVLGALPRAAALELVARSRLAVVLAQGQDYQVPAKLYESVALGIATLVVTGPETAADREARRLGAAVVEPDDVAGMVRVFEDVWADPDRRRPRPRGGVDYRELAPSVSDLLFGEPP